MTRRPTSLTVIALVACVLTALVAAPSASAAEPSTVLAWGLNRWGEVGDGTTTRRAAPLELPGLTDISAVAAGYDHSLALRSDGRVLAWGSNMRGQLGDPSTLGQIVQTPTLVPGLVDIVRIDAYLYSNVAIDDKGGLWQWGQAVTGGGVAVGPLMSSPARIDNIAATAAAAGMSHRLAVAYGTVRGWGTNRSGEQGDETTWPEWRPTPGRMLDNAVDVGAGVEHSVILRDDGSVWTVGRNDTGQLGDGTQSERHTPVQVAAISNVVAIDAADRNSMALRADGTLWAWGDRAGALGDEVTANATTPRQIAGLSGVARFDLGGLTAAAITDQGVWSWGREPGNADFSWYPDPLLLSGTAGATDVARGFDHGLIVLNGAPDAPAPVLPPPLATTLSVEGPSAVPVNEAVSFTATVSPSPGGGTVTLSTDGTELSSAVIDSQTGSATLWTTFSEEKTVPLVVDFAAVSGFEGSSKTFQVKVGRTHTTTEIVSIEPANPGPGSPITVTAKVSPAPEAPAAVVVYIDERWVNGAEVEDGVARVPVGTLETGTYSVAAQFVGNDNYLYSVSEPQTLVVSQDTTPPTGAVRIRDVDGYSESLSVPLEFEATDGDGVGVALVGVSHDGVAWEDREWPLAEEWVWTLSQSATARDGEYTVYVRFADRNGAISETYTDTTVVDRTAPKLSGTVTSRVVSSENVTPSGGAVVSVRWPAARDTGTGVSEYLVEQSLDGDAWTEWRRVAPGSESTLEVRDVVEAESVRHRVTALDPFGRASLTITGPRLSLTRYQDSAADVTTTGAWTSNSAETAWGGGTITTASKGATLKLRFTGRAIYWVAPTGGSRGRAEVSIDGKVVSTVDLSQDRGDRAIVFGMEFADIGDRAIKIRVLDGTIEVDGFIAARW